MEKTITLDGEEIDKDSLENSGRLKSVVDTIKILKTKTGKDYARIKVVGDTREFTIWDTKIIDNLEEGKEIEFLFVKKVTETQDRTWINYNITELIEHPEDMEGLSKDTKELIKQCIQKIEKKELEKEIDAVGKVQEELNKDPLKYDDNDFKKMVQEVDNVREENKIEHVKVSEVGVVTTQIDITDKELQQKEIVIPGIVIKKPGTYTLVLGLI
jgi:hypothetical protein